MEVSSTTMEWTDNDGDVVDTSSPNEPQAEATVISGAALLSGTLNVEHMARAETLHMQGCNYDDSVAEYVVKEVLPRAHALRTVEVADTRFSPLGLLSVLRALCNSSGDTLEKLCLSDVHLHNEECAMLQQVVVKHASRLKELQLQRCHMDDVAAQAVAEGISRAGCLQELWIADNDVLPAFAVQLGESLAFPASLTVLDLSGNRIDPAHHRGLFRAFRRCAATLQEVYLARCCIAEDGLNAVLNAGVYASHALRVLSVSSGRLFRSAGRVLCGVLTECPNLERLYVQENFIEADGAVRMSVGIPYAKKLAVLGMGRCHIGGRGARAVAEAVMQSSSMCELDISGNSIQDADVQDICRHSNVSSLRLKFLDLSDNPLTERCWLALKALLEAHKDNPCIVVVRGTQLGAKSSYLEYNEPSPSC